MQMIVVAELGNGGEGTGAGVSSWGGGFQQVLVQRESPWSGSGRVCSGFIPTVLSEIGKSAANVITVRKVCIQYIYDRILMSPYLRVCQNRNTSFPISSCLPFLSHHLSLPLRFSLIQSRLICYLFKVLMCFQITLLRIRLFTHVYSQISLGKM